MITVAEDDGFSIIVEVDYWAIVWDVKVQVSACGTHPAFQRLSFGGFDLRDGEPLYMYDIEHLATVDLIRDVMPSHFILQLCTDTAWVLASEVRLARQAHHARWRSRQLWMMGKIVVNARRRLRRRRRKNK